MVATFYSVVRGYPKFASGGRRSIPKLLPAHRRSLEAEWPKRPLATQLRMRGRKTLPRTTLLLDETLLNLTAKIFGKSA
jgi:hypothetical protein